MSIKSDRWIKRMAREHQMIEPFVESQVRGSAISYGVSSYGYDIRVADEFNIFTNINNTVIDPKNFDPRSFVDVQTDVCIVPAELVCARADHRVFPDPPRRAERSTLSNPNEMRCGIIVNVTPFEPEWEGTVTLEDLEYDPSAGENTPMKGIAQVLFFQSDEPCEMSYKDKKGKYQAQTGVTLPKISKATPDIYINLARFHPNNPGVLCRAKWTN